MRRSQAEEALAQKAIGGPSKVTVTIKSGLWNKQNKDGTRTPDISSSQTSEAAANQCGKK
jgi:hypothetical protein